jgi:signal transduction histidine kinase
LVRQEVAAADPAPLDAIRSNWKGPANDTPVRQVMATGEPLFLPEVQDENWSYIADPEQRGALISLGIRSAIMVPIRVDGETFGTMSFARTGASPRFTRFDVLIARELARRAAQAIDRSRLYERERRARREAEEASRAKDEFLAILSHELRTPLTTVIGWADLLKMSYQGGDAEIAHAIDALRASAGIQSRLIDDLLDVSRIVAGKLTIERKRIDLACVVRTSAETLRLAAEAKELKLTIEADEPIFVNADPARVQQIVTNLVTNAIKFTPSGGNVDVRVARRDHEAEIVVTDTGVGIAPDFLPHVFERFRQASSGDSRNYMGLGLGLSIVHYVVQQHGGRVRAESDGIGKGARFTVSVPIASP